MVLVPESQPSQIRTVSAKRERKKSVSMDELGHGGCGKAGLEYADASVI